MSDTKEPTPADPNAKDPAAKDAKKAKKKGSRGKLFLILGLAVVLLGGGGFAAYWTMLRTPAEAAEGGEAVTDAKKEEAGGTGIVSFEPFVVNLADPGGQRFLRINVRLIVGDEKEAEEIQKSEVQLMRLRSDILELLTQQTADQIVKQEGKAALKKTISERAHHIVEPVEVSDVLFSDFVVQY